MLIISVLQNFQAKIQAVLECHDFWMVAPNKGSKIDGKIGNEPVFFYEPFIGQHVSVVDVVVRIRQESIERPMDRIVFPGFHFNRQDGGIVEVIQKELHLAMGLVVVVVERS